MMPSRPLLSLAMLTIACFCQTNFLCKSGDCTDGTGEARDRDESGTYKGAFKAGLLHGFGTFVFDKGSIYAGYWENDNANGHGVFTWPNGDVYDGNWDTDEKSGHGTII